VNTGIHALLATLLLAMATDPVAPVPVMIGSEPDLNACPSLAQVGGAKSGLVSVRAAPKGEAKEIDRLANGDYAYVCDTSGEWTGVVYRRGKEMAPDCGVASPAKRGPYRGACKSGWVRSKWLTVVAG
jgi:hypothetical protein